MARVVFDPVEFRDLYPQFTAELVTDGQLRQAFDVACLLLDNSPSLPPGANEYAVISVLFTTQHGTAIEEFHAPDPDKSVPGVLTLVALSEARAQVDICGENDLARRRARGLALVLRSCIGVQFFNDYGLTALYADDVSDLSFIGDAKQFVRRYTTTLHLGFWTGISAGFDYFDTAAVSRLEDVDARHNPQES
jgi:hypothetical protein